MKSLWLGRLCIHGAMQSRGSNGFDPTWMGFSYGSWLPRFHVEGFIRRPNKIVEASGYWLCFHWSVTWWGNMTPGHGMWGVK